MRMKHAENYVAIFETLRAMLFKGGKFDLVESFPLVFSIQEYIYLYLTKLDNNNIHIYKLEICNKMEEDPSNKSIYYSYSCCSIFILCSTSISL